MTADSRLLSLLGMLAAGRTYTASELAAYFGVTPRSIRRDMASLRRLGYFIESLPGVAGGYRAESRTVLPPLQLQTGEAIATAVGLALLNGAGLSTSDAESAAAKLREMLPPTVRESVGDISTAVSVLAGHEPGVDISVVITTASAIASSVVLTFDYTKRRRQASAGRATADRLSSAPSARAATSSRRVEPVRLVVLGAHWYLYAWDLDRADWRVFRLDRMGSVHATTFGFSFREHLDAEAAVSSAVTTAAYRHRVVLHVAASVAEVEAWFPTRTATIVEMGEAARVEFGADDLRWAAVITASTPVDVSVIEPPELLVELRELGKRASRVGETGVMGVSAPARSE